MSKPVQESWKSPPSGNCFCSLLRRVSRNATSIYDRHLEPTGLTVTQYALLVNIARNTAATPTELAEILGMDRTTVKRDLAPLERMGLIDTVSHSDKRFRPVALTPAGKTLLPIAYERWAAAQEEIIDLLGIRQVENLRKILAITIETLGAAR